MHHASQLLEFVTIRSDSIESNCTTLLSFLRPQSR